MTKTGCVAKQSTFADATNLLEGDWETLAINTVNNVAVTAKDTYITA